MALSGGRTAPVRVLKVKPVIKDAMWRTVRERQRMAREMRAGRECQVRNRVPNIKITRRVVMM